MINKSSRGFTLIETLVAVFILSVSIAGPLTVASRALSAALVAKNQITAFYLAQDAIEYIRFARDTNKLSGATNWLTGAGSTAPIDISQCQSATGCYLDSTGFCPLVPTAAGTAVSTGSCTVDVAGTNGRPLYFDNTTKRFTYHKTSPNTKTVFTRKITITQPQTGEAVVTATVYWNDLASVVHNVTITENLFDWQ
jgi:prepilin-type N-terminal cleavage/methylation domain-containing protein